MWGVSLIKALALGTSTTGPKGENGLYINGYKSNDKDVTSKRMALKKYIEFFVKIILKNIYIFFLIRKYIYRFRVQSIQLW